MKKSFTHEFGWDNTVEWYTPRYLFEQLKIKFDLDPCSPGKSIVPWIPAKHHFTKEQDGLLHKWFGKVWLNPPYGRETGKWLKKMAKHGNGIALVYSRTDTVWFQKYAVTANIICFMDTRMHFVPNFKVKEYHDDNWDLFLDTYTDPKDGKEKKSQTGCGSILLAWGKECSEALLRTNLGICLRT